MTKSKLLNVSLIAIAISFLPRFAMAEGALAISIVTDVRKGFAAATSSNFKTFEEAEKDALQACREEKTAPEVVKRLCKVILTYRDQCAAIAIDPAAGTPGAGWAIAPTKAEAENIALAACERTAGTNRRGKCEVTAIRWDGSAK
jgi:hypothetical protein